MASPLSSLSCKFNVAISKRDHWLSLDMIDFLKREFMGLRWICSYEEKVFVSTFFTTRNISLSSIIGNVYKCQPQCLNTRPLAYMQFEK